MITTSCCSTLDLEEAAEFLGLHPNTLQERAKAKEIPGAKIGKNWRFIDVDLIAYLRSQYAASSNESENKKCHSTSGVKRGGSILRTRVSEFDEALGLQTRKRPSASTTDSEQNSGTNVQPLRNRG